MDSSSPVRVAPISGILHPISPDRMNQQWLSQSPSIPSHINESKHHRSSSDVQSKVAFLNNLSRMSVNPSQSQHGSGSTSAALQRAIIGREEAEAALSELRAEMVEAQTRERRISERLDSLMEDLQNTKERQAHERQVYEKEIKRSRKEAFRAGSALVKLQEDLKESRAEIRTLKSSVQKEKYEKEKSRQEAFERAYTLAGITEEMHALKEKLRAMESQEQAGLLNEQADSMSIDQDDFNKENSPPHEEKLLREALDSQKEASAANTEALTGVSEQHNEIQSRRNRFERPLLSSAMEKDVLAVFGDTLQPRRETFFKSAIDEDDMHLQDQIEDLKAELAWQRRCKEEAEDLVHFMNMECQFRTCACRRAELEGKKFVHDWQYENKIRAQSAERKEQSDAVTAELEVSTDPLHTVTDSCNNEGSEGHELSIDDDVADDVEATMIKNEVIADSYTPLTSPTTCAINKALPPSTTESPNNTDELMSQEPTYTNQTLFDIGCRSIRSTTPASIADATERSTLR